MEGLIKDGFELIDLKLGLELPKVVGDAAAVGAATRVGELEALVDNVVLNGTPASIMSC